MTLQTSIQKIIEQYGQPATVTWQGSNSLRNGGEQDSTIETTAYLYTRQIAITDARGFTTASYAVMPAQDRSLVGASIILAGKTWGIVAEDISQGGGYGPLLVKVTLA